MPVARFQMPDGRVARFEVPDGTTPEQAQEMIAQAMPDVPASVSAGKEINSIPRQLGLTARYGLEGVANAAQLVTEPLRYATDRLFGATGKTVPLGVLATQAADKMGLPKPQGANERVIGDATRLVAGAGGMGGVAGVAGRAPGMVGEAGRLLSSNMGQQLSSAAGAGLAGGASREAGGSPVMQAGAALAGGVVGGMAPGAAGSVMDAGKRLLTAKPSPQQIDVQISAIMDRAGVDYSQIPERVRQSLRQDLAQALNTGQELDPAAVRRLADFRLTGLTPTRGAVTQDPVQITREMNLAKTGANSADGQLQGLARIQNQNNSQLIQNLNSQGARQGDVFRAGQTTLGAIRGRDAQMEGVASNLYQQARDSAGRSLPLNGADFTRRANAALDEAMLGYALPSSVQTRMNQIAQGEVPFTIDYAEQFKKQLNQLSGASNDRAVQRAISTVRRALDEAPIVPAQQVNPGNLPVAPGVVPPSPLTQGREALDAFDRARAAARARFQWQESGRPIEAALNGAQPDKFVQQFVIGGTLDDARAIAQNAPREEVRNAIMAHLKDKALNGAADEVGKFSQSAFNKALNTIGDRKLSLFFSPEELASLRANARVASYTQVQPVGSAVNNSNSGALLLGRGIDALSGFANGLPVIGPMVSQPITNGINNLNVAIRTQQAQNVAPGLLVRQPRPPIGQGLLLPGMAVGGLLAAP